MRSGRCEAQQPEDLVDVPAVDGAGLVAHGRLHQGRDHQVVDERRVGRGARALQHEREPGQHLPLVGLVLVEGEHRLAVVGHVAQRELEQRQVVVALLQRGGRREDHVGVAGGLVDVDVDRHHALEVGQRGVEACRVRRRQHRVAGDGHERADLPLARACPSPRPCTTAGQLAEGLGQLAHPARAAVQAHLAAERGLPRVLLAPAAAVVNMAPPGRSRLPVSTLSTSTSHDVRVPNSAVVVPMRPYTHAVGAAASSRASRRIVVGVDAGGRRHRPRA